MDIKKAVFLKSAAQASEAPETGLPEVAIVGRSNVGKSSLINCITNNNKLAKIGNTPGKTRLLNFFEINGLFVLVDLPGYGFAKASKTEQARWGEMIESYLQSSEKLCHIIMLVDMRHAPSLNDIQMCVWLRHFGYDFTIVATKCDKIAKSKWITHLRDIRKTLSLPESCDIIPFSAVERHGKQRLLDAFDSIILT